MRVSGTRRRRTKTSRGSPVAGRRACLLAVVCLAWAGCEGPQRVAGDPLLGRSAAVTPGPRPNQTAGASGVPALPPLPAPTTAGSTAALAAGAAPVFDGRHNLQIDDPRPTAGNPAWTSPTAGGTVLQQPVPIPGQSAPPTGAAPAPGTIALVSGPKVTSYEQAQAQLAARGVLWQRLEAVANQQWKFSCSVPNPQNKQISRVYEAQAASGLEAIQAILEQIDKDR